MLLDCGLVQGGEDSDARNRREFPFDPARIDAVILSHAHIDHCGRLPLLVRRGFRGPIHSTRPCRDRRPIEPLFTLEDAERALRLFRVHSYEESIHVLPGVELRFRDAGHIMGSASVWLRLVEGSVTRHVVFSGDVGQYGSPILRDPQTDPDTPVDLVMMESTYGDRLHRPRADTLRELGEILRGARRDGGNVLIPAFAVGRSQDLLYELARHYREWQLDDWQVFLDSPMAIEASTVYWRYRELYDEEAAALKVGPGGFPPLPNLRLVHGETGAANVLRDAFRGRGVTAALARPGLKLDLGSGADVRA